MFVQDNIKWENEERTLGTNLSFSSIFASRLSLFCFHLLLKIVNLKMYFMTSY